MEMNECQPGRCREQQQKRAFNSVEQRKEEQDGMGLDRRGVVRPAYIFTSSVIMPAPIPTLMP